MTYYRLAIQHRQTTQWTWKPTTVSSVQAVFQLLRIYRMLPQDGIRVFTAASKEDLREMLKRQNPPWPPALSPRPNSCEKKTRCSVKLQLMGGGEHRNVVTPLVGVRPPARRDREPLLILVRVHHHNRGTCE